MGHAAPSPGPSPASAAAPARHRRPLLAALVVVLLALGTCVLGWVSGPSSATSASRAGAATVSPAPSAPGRQALPADVRAQVASYLRGAAASDQPDAELRDPDPARASATTPPSPTATAAAARVVPPATPRPFGRAGAARAPPVGPPSPPVPT